MTSRGFEKRSCQLPEDIKVTKVLQLMRQLDEQEQTLMEEDLMNRQTMTEICLGCMVHQRYYTCAPPKVQGMDGSPKGAEHP